MNKKQTKFILLDPHRCIACWECVDVCPKQVIGKVQILWHKHIVFKDADACIGCKKCIKTCKQQVFAEK
ncbi:4Fe-4S binding protein [Bacteroides sp. Marseille-P8574]|uniref:4Fe-4S binding protein n=1 Tax=Bacteroides sp. Marseille-P8574 TaxID=2697504 RepID=UPI00157DD790|nr:4Fe-4S binding protein [Bacteroides sp. Marseille-P8574]